MSLFEAAWAPSGGEQWRRVAAEGALTLAVIGVVAGIAAVAALPLWGAGAVVGLTTAGVLWRYHSHAAARPFGLANWVTLFRLNLVALMLLALWPGEPGSVAAWLLFLIAVSVLVLDGVDGWLARWRGEVSDFGQRLDMAADTAFTIITTLCLVSFGLVGAWVLVVGLMRPAFVAAARIWSALSAPLPESRGRKIACGGSLACLVAGLAPPLAPLAPAFALLALVQLVWSFGRDLRYLLGGEAAV